MQKIHENVQETLANLVVGSVDIIQFSLAKFFHILLSFITDLYQIFSSDIHHLSPVQIDLFSLITSIWVFCYILAKAVRFIARLAEKADAYFIQKTKEIPTKQAIRMTRFNLRIDSERKTSRKD